ncbi:MAG: hypothetical protein AB1898_02610 [Acidobacteriota bacterium]
MHYRFAHERMDYSDLASGRVFYSRPGRPALPVRLASEIFQRCLAIRKAQGQASPCVLFDPCCGGAYHLSVLACLHRQSISGVVASDIDEEAVSLAGKNLGLLGGEGIDARIRQISAMLRQYGKESHKEALESAVRLRDQLARLAPRQPFMIKTFRADATDGSALLDQMSGVTVDIVLTDVPYGKHSVWNIPSGEGSSKPLWLILQALSQILLPTSVVAIASDKRQKAAHEGYQRVEQFQVGKRRVVILRPVNRAQQQQPGGNGG